jgi:hypothetical protein
VDTTDEAPSLNFVAHTLNHADINWVVFAGSAAIIYGANRPITDIDILISSADGARAAALFPGCKVCHGKDGRIEAIKLPDFDLIAGLSNGYRLDVDNEILLRSCRAEINGVNVPVISPEDNILIKASWGRGPEVGKHDWQDVKAMLRSKRKLDWDYLCGRASTGLDPDRADEVLTQLEQLWRRIYDEALYIR